MKFLIDNQLPIALCAWLKEKSLEAVHVIEVGLDAASDESLWEYAEKHRTILISKDEDFFHLSVRSSALVQVVWIRIGNCRTSALLNALEIVWPDIVNGLSSNEKIIEIR